MTTDSNKNEAPKGDDDKRSTRPQQCDDSQKTKSRLKGEELESRILAP